MRGFSILGGPDEHPQECPPDAAQSSRAGAAGGGRGTDPEGGGRRLRGLRQNGAQMGRALQGRRPCRPARPLLPAASPAPADAWRHVATDRSPAPPALDRQADRRGGRRLAGHRQPHPAAPRPEPAQGARAGRAGAALRARASRRTDPHRHQEARPLRARRPPHHRRSNRPEQQPRHRLGVRPRLHRRRLARRLLQILPDEKKESAVAFLKAAVAYYAQPRRHGRHAS